jgi:hypothetical protein
VCIGSLNRQIVVNTRLIGAPTGGTVDFTETFTPERTVWAMLETTNAGTVIFDSTNTAQEISHNIYIRFMTTMTPEKWVRLPSINGGVDVYLDIIAVENLNEENRFHRLRCNLRGDTALPVNFS